MIECSLTDRQMKMISLLADGLNRQQAAAELGIGESMACIDVREAAKTLQVKRRDAALVAAAFRKGWLS